MAETANKEFGEGAGISGEYKRPDAAAAIGIYRDEIAGKLEHISTIKGDLSDPYKRIKDECNFPRKVLDLLMQLDDMEDAKRQHWLLAFSEGCKHLNIRIEADLVSMANGEEGVGPIVPTGERSHLSLVGVDDDGDGFEEASEAELAAQKPRADEAEAKKVRKGSSGVSMKPVNPPADDSDLADEGFIEEDEEQPEAAE